MSGAYTTLEMSKMGMTYTGVGAGDIYVYKIGGELFIMQHITDDIFFEVRRCKSKNIGSVDELMKELKKL
ncbi:MAG: hypothetical protein V1900_00340 [Candidatus Aenigmatarchaeota archaeon]